MIVWRIAVRIFRIGLRVCIFGRCWLPDFRDCLLKLLLQIGELFGLFGELAFCLCRVSPFRLRCLLTGGAVFVARIGNLVAVGPFRSSESFGFAGKVFESLLCLLLRLGCGLKLSVFESLLCLLKLGQRFRTIECP